MEEIFMEHLAPILKKTSEAIEKKANVILQANDITFPQARILFCLYTHTSEAVSLKELEKLLSASQQTTASTVSRLEHKGLVAGSIDGQDGRVKRISLTEKGKQLSQSTIEKLDIIDYALTSCLYDDEKDTLFYLLNKVYDNIK